MSDHVVRNFMTDEEFFLAHATIRELVLLTDYFRMKAAEALSPEEHEFYADRVQQIAVRAAIH